MRCDTFKLALKSKKCRKFETQSFGIVLIMKSGSKENAAVTSSLYTKLLRGTDVSLLGRKGV